MRYWLKILSFLIILGLSLTPGQVFANKEFGEIINSGIARGKSPICSLRDKYGFLWVGTQTGLSCYDGNGVVLLSESSGPLKSTLGTKITSVLEVGDDIWFGASHGVKVYDRSQNKCIDFPLTTKYGVNLSSEVNKIMRVNDDIIWIITNGQGFFVYDGRNNTLTQNSQNGSFYSDIVVAEGGQVFAISLDGYIQRFTPEGYFIHSLRLPGFMTDKGRLDMELADNFIWISSRTHLYRYNPRSVSIERESSVDLPSEINKLSVNDSTFILLGTNDGIWMYDIPHRNLSKLNISSSLPDLSVNDIGIDADDNFIVSTPIGGISFLMRHSEDIQRYQNPDWLKGQCRVYDFCAAENDNEIYVGTEKGVSIFNVETGKFVNSNNFFIGVPVTNFCQSPEGIWIGTQRQGLYFFDNATKSLRHYSYDEEKPYSLISNDINYIYRTSTGDVYIMTKWGMCKYNPAQDNFHTLAEVNSSVSFHSMEEDAQGRLWMSTTNDGLFYKPDPQTRFQIFSSDKIGNASVTSMLLNGKTGIFWITTQDNKLLYFDEDLGDFVEFELPFTNKHAITFIEDDADGNLWIGTTGGIRGVTPEGSITYFSNPPLTDDIPPIILPTASLKNDKIIVGSSNHLMVFDPHSIHSETLPVKVYIQSISFPFAEDNDAEIERLGLNVPLHKLQSIKLPYNDNTFTLNFSSSRFGATPNVVYRYMLEGVDKQWIEGDHEVTYKNLAPGKYKLHLRSDLDQSNNISTLEIIITPPWYRSWYAYLIYALLFVLILWYIIQSSRQRLRKQYEDSLREMEHRQERELHQSQMNFFVNLVHENRTPLTLINLQLDELAEKIEASEDKDAKASAKHISSMRRNVNYLLRITNQLLDIRKAEHDEEFRLNKIVCNLSKLTQDICQRFQEPLAVMGKKIVLELPEKDIIAEVDPEKIDRVMMNIIGNAMKYSKSLIEVSLSLEDDDKCRISVTDDGPGIPEKERETVLEKYHQLNLEKTPTGPGTGLGLSYAKLAAEAHGGKISVEDNKYGGATLSVTLPIGNVDAPVKAVESEVIGATSTIIEDLDQLPTEVFDSSRPRPTVLLVEDNKELISVMAQALGKDFNIVTASNGAEGWHIVNGNVDIDIIVSDFMMPKKDGGEFCRKVKSNMETSHIPFIMLTAKVNIEAKIEGMESGADVYMEKPFSMKQLKLQIYNLLQMRQLFFDRMSKNLINPGVVLFPTQDAATSSDSNSISREQPTPSKESQIQQSQPQENRTQASSKTNQNRPTGMEEAQENQENVSSYTGPQTDSENVQSKEPEEASSENGPQTREESNKTIQAPTKGGLNALDLKFIETINALILENICDEEFTIDVLAEKMNMSRSSFYRKIKGVSGMTPVDYLKNYRLDYAAKLLVEGNRVSEVAMMAGFTSSSYFAKCFKAKFGVIPKNYTD